MRVRGRLDIYAKSPGSGPGPWLQLHYLDVDAFSQCITATRKLLRQSLRLIQQCFTLRNE
jgi:hypothetical protein